MLYHARANVLYAYSPPRGPGLAGGLGGPPMPVTAPRHRDTRRAQMGRVAPRAPRPYVPPDPGPRPAPPDPGPVDHAFAWVVQFGRWRRVSHWWTFSARQLEEILACN